MRKLSTLLVAGFCLFMSCKQIDCIYEPVVKGEEHSNELMEKYVSNFHLFFKCPESDTVGAERFPPSNGNFIIRPDTMPCPPPYCRNNFLMSSISDNPNSELIVEGETMLTMKAAKIKDPGVNKDYYGFIAREAIIDNKGILKLTLVEGKDSLVRYVKFEE